MVRICCIPITCTELAVSHRKPTLYFGRFMSYVLHDEIVGCWIWLGSVVAGYGQFWVEGRPCKAHRVAFELFEGKIDGGKHLHHECQESLCVNPGHVVQVTSTEHGLLHREMN